MIPILLHFTPPSLLTAASVWEYDKNRNTVEIRNLKVQGETIMTMTGFDNQQYLHLQSQHIRDRIAQFGGKLYLEFGGKLFDDYHASRVLPGFEPDSKIRMLEQLRDKAEIIIAINAGDIEKNKVRGDLGITYDSDVLRLIDIFRSRDLYEIGRAHV